MLFFHSPQFALNQFNFGQQERKMAHESTFVHLGKISQKKKKRIFQQNESFQI